MGIFDGLRSKPVAKNEGEGGSGAQAQHNAGDEKALTGIKIIDFTHVQAGTPGKKAVDMLNLDRPALDWVSLAKGMGVPGVSVTNSEDFTKELERSHATAGPRLIEVVM